MRSEAGQGRVGQGTPAEGDDEEVKKKLPNVACVIGTRRTAHMCLQGVLLKQQGGD